MPQAAASGGGAGRGASACGEVPAAEPLLSRAPTAARAIADAAHWLPCPAKRADSPPRYGAWLPLTPRRLPLRPEARDITLEALEAQVRETAAVYMRLDDEYVPARAVLAAGSEIGGRALAEASPPIFLSRKGSIVFQQPLRHFWTLRLSAEERRHLLSRFPPAPAAEGQAAGPLPGG